ncbi:hypothetical protein [Actinoplanes sp. OR16]|uniref:hypothetical protein n=1 Tax=Actinoplanes sp. OR16 TaxID=946334 RepID=UPI000FDA0928|nr:hypothetical protein [Actinoplanes sp. OR16]
MEQVDGTNRVRFAVEAVVKGTAATEVTLTTSDNEASCGYRFDEGGRYRVYSIAGMTTLCSGNELLTAGPSPSATARAQQQAAADRTMIFWAGSGLVALFVVAGLALLLRHPRSGN